MQSKPGSITIIFDKGTSRQAIYELIEDKYYLKITYLSTAVMPTCHAQILNGAPIEDFCSDLEKEADVLKAYQTISTDRPITPK